MPLLFYWMQLIDLWEMKSWMNKHWTQWTITLGLSLIAMILSYLCTNMNVPISGEKSVLRYWCAFTDWVTSGKESDLSDDVVFINVANDKQLVDITDEFGIPTGNAVVTDREKLCRLLEIINASGDYKYVMLDVIFEDGYQTEADSSLFELIGRMNRIVLPKHEDVTLASGVPQGKVAFSDYRTTIDENDFTKYQLFQKDGPSMPLKMYSDITGRTVKRTGLWYSDKASLARKVIFPKMYVRIDSPYRSDGQKAYLNMGSDILSYADDVDWSDLFAKKVVVIGAFSGDDIHTTYAGDLPGSLINYNVFLSLMKGQHRIPLLLILTYFIIFFVMALLLLRRDGGQHQSWAWVWAKLFLFYSVILTVVCIIVFGIWGQAHDIFITSTFFSLVDLINRQIKHS